MFDNSDPNRGGLPQAGKTCKVAHLDIVNPQTNALVGVSDDASAAAAALGYTIIGGEINLMGIREGSFTGTTSVRGGGGGRGERGGALPDLPDVLNDLVLCTRSELGVNLLLWDADDDMLLTTTQKEEHSSCC